MSKDLIKRIDKKAILSDRSRSEVIKELLVSVVFAEPEPTPAEAAKVNAETWEQRLFRMRDEVGTLAGEIEADRKLNLTKKHGSYGTKNIGQELIEMLIMGNPCALELEEILEMRVVLEAKHRNLDPVQAMSLLDLHVSPDNLDQLQNFVHRKVHGTSPRIEND